VRRGGTLAGVSIPPSPWASPRRLRPGGSAAALDGICPSQQARQRPMRRRQNAMAAWFPVAAQGWAPARLTVSAGEMTPMFPLWNGRGSAPPNHPAKGRRAFGNLNLAPRAAGRMDAETRLCAQRGLRGVWRDSRALHQGSAVQALQGPGGRRGGAPPTFLSESRYDISKAFGGMARTGKALPIMRGGSA